MVVLLVRGGAASAVPPFCLARIILFCNDKVRMKHYYRKAFPTNKVKDGNGETIPFEPLTTSWSFLALDDADEKHKYWVGELAKLMSDRVGGVESITEGQYSELYVEKKTSLIPLLPDWAGGRAGDGRDALVPGQQNSQDTRNVRVKPAAVAESQNQPTAPVIPAPPEPKTSPKPQTGKLPKVALPE